MHILVWSSYYSIVILIISHAVTGLQLIPLLIVVSALCTFYVLYTVVANTQTLSDRQTDRQTT